MDNTVVVALLGLCGSCLGSIFGILTANKLSNYRIEQLEKKVQAHNNLIERTYNLEESVRVNNEKIKNIHRRIEDLHHLDTSSN